MKSDLQPLKTHRRQNVKKRELKNLRDGMSPEDRIGAWLSAALEDPMVCDEMKQDIKDWFDQTNDRIVRATDFECPRCGHCCQALETEPFEYWSVAGGWVKLDEMREHFEIAGCGTIYKSGGEGRVPLYTAPKQWVGLTLNEAEDFYDKYPDRAELINAIDKFLMEKNNG